MTLADRHLSIALDVVIPLYNEEAVIDALVERLREVFTPDVLMRHAVSHVRFVLVDDGSTDRTAEILAARIAAGLPAVLCRLSRNFGHQAAVVAGLDHAEGDVVAVIDADLQDPPQELLAMLAKWRQGYDVVYGVRSNRKEGWAKRLCYYLFYRVLHYLSEGRIPEDSGDFCLMGRPVVEAIRRLPERLRFVRGLRAWVGFRQIAHAYERQERAMGKPKYTFAKLYHLATDGIAASSIRPLRIAQLFAIIFFFVAAGALVASIIQLVRTANVGAPLSLLYLLMALTSVTGFAVLLCLYVLSAYIGRMYLEVKGRPAYVLMELIRPPAGRRGDL